MKRPHLLILATLILFSCQTNAQEVFQKLKSPHTVEATVAKLNSILAEKGMNVFATIDHQEGATKAGLELRPTTLVIFGNPKVGTKLMQCDQSVGYALPLKMLIWQDEMGDTWVGYWDPIDLGKEYNLDSCAEVLIKVKNAMSNFAKAATS